MVIYGYQKTMGLAPGGGRKKQPRLPHVTDQHLTDTAKLLDLYGQAVELGLAHGGEAGRLRFVAAAERALQVGDRPAALFAGIVNQGRWVNVSCHDEDRAAARLKRDLFGERLPQLDQAEAYRLAARRAGP